MPDAGGPSTQLHDEPPQGQRSPWVWEPMTVDLCLLGELRDGSRAEGWLSRVQEWAHVSWVNTLVDSTLGDDVSGRLALALGLHPAAPDVVLIANAAAQVELRAATATVGPGYHAHVCELARRLEAELGIAWDRTSPAADVTGFFLTGDRTALEHAMLAALGRSARDLLSAPPRPDRAARLGLPATHRYSMPGSVLTALGPRNLAWLLATAERPDSGRDAFAWWEIGVGPRYELGRALADLWLNVRFRTPADDEERELLASVHHRLAMVHAADGTLDLPYGEWEEIARYLGAGTRAPELEVASTRDPIGYRRHSLRVVVGGDFSLRIDGGLAERWEGIGALTAWDGGRTLCIDTTPESESPLSTRDGSNHGLDARPPRDTLAMGVAPIGISLAAPLRGSFDLRSHRDEDAVVHEIEGVVGAGGKEARVCVAFARAEDEAWAIGTVESLRFEG